MVHLTIKDRDLTDLTIKNDGTWWWNLYTGYNGEVLGVYWENLSQAITNHT